MRVNICDKCAGTGWMKDPRAKWWQFWLSIPCDACGGDGQAKPPGWPDQAEMDRLRPPAPPPPPPPKRYA